MTTNTGEIMRGVFADQHSRVSASLDVAAKVHPLLPDGLTLSEWSVLPGELRGQMSHTDDASAIAWIVAVSRMDGWRFEQGHPKHGNYRSGTYMTIAAVTEVDEVEVRVWCLIKTDLVPLSGEVAA